MQPTPFHTRAGRPPATGRPAGRAGFTLVEMLVVIVIIGILTAMSGLGMVKARELARRTRAETELRSLVEATLQYQQFYGEWPSRNAGVWLSADRNVLGPLTDPDHPDNPRKIVLLNLTLPDQAGTYNDPWGTPYQLYLHDEAAVELPRVAIRTSVTFPNRDRRLP